MLIPMALMGPNDQTLSHIKIRPTVFLKIFPAKIPGKSLQNTKWLVNLFATKARQKWPLEKNWNGKEWNVTPACSQTFPRRQQINEEKRRNNRVLLGMSILGCLNKTSTDLLNWSLIHFTHLKGNPLAFNV